MSESSRPTNSEVVLSEVPEWSVLNGSFDEESLTPDFEERYAKIEDLARFMSEDAVIRIRTHETTTHAIELSNPSLFSDEKLMKDMHTRVAAAVMLDAEVPDEYLAKKVVASTDLPSLNESAAVQFLGLLSDKGLVEDRIRIRVMAALERLLKSESS